MASIQKSFILRTSYRKPFCDSLISQSNPVITSPANLYSDIKLRKRVPQHKTVRMKCAVPPFLRPKPGTQCHAARRLYVSRLANFRSSSRPQIRGSAQGCALPPVSQGWLIWREPRSPEQELERLVCSAS